VCVVPWCVKTEEMENLLAIEMWLLGVSSRIES
jgi:hypothetical protein